MKATIARRRRRFHPHNRMTCVHGEARPLVSAPASPWTHGRAGAPSRQMTPPPEEEGHQAARQPIGDPVPAAAEISRRAIAP